MNINFVMSSFVQSSIFEHLIDYFRQFGTHRIVVTKDAVENADLYYYFRPHLEKKLHPNSIVTVHHDLEDDDPNLAIERFLPRYREAAVVVCLNSHQQKILEKYGIVNTVVIPHGYNDDVLFPLPKCSGGKKTIGYFSHHYARNVKGEDYFLSLLAKLDRAAIKIILAGKKRKPLCDDIKRLGYECDLYESLPYYKYNELYSMIDVLMITSRYEGGPASVPEAMATNTPIVATKVGMIHDLLDNPNICLLTGNTDVDISTIMSVCFDQKFDHSNNMQFPTWKDIVLRYDELFLQIFQASIQYKQDSCKKNVNLTDLYWKRIDYFYHTLYPKKRLKEKLIQIKNVCYMQLLNQKQKKDK